jgi:hypothetical protein
MKDHFPVIFMLVVESEKFTVKAWADDSWHIPFC